MDLVKIKQDLLAFRDLTHRLQQTLEQLPAPELASLRGSFPEADRLLRPPAGQEPDRDRHSLAREQMALQLADLLKESQQQKALLKAIFEADPGGIAVVVGSELKLAFANPTYRFLCPHPEADLIGQLYEAIWSSEDSSCYAQQIRVALETGRPFQTLDFKRHLPGGMRNYTLQTRRIDWGDQPAALLALWDTTQQKIVEAALQEQQEYSQNILETSNEGILIADLSGIITYANPRMAEMLGYSTAELVGKPGVSFIDVASLPVAEEKISGRSEGLRDDYEMKFLRKDGSPLWVLASGSPIYNSQKQHTGNLGMYTDINERKQHEQALQKSQARLTDVLESIYDGFYTVDWDWTFTYANRRINAITGVDFQVFVGQNLWEARPRWIGTSYETALRRAMEQREVVQLIVKGIYLDLWYDITIYPTQEGISVFFTDRTETHKAEEAQRETEERTRITLSSIGDGVITTDDQGRVTFLNPAAEKLTGWTDPAAAGQPLEQVFSMINEQTGQPAENPVAKVLRDGVVVGLANHTALISRGGQAIPIEDSAAPIRDAAGKIHGVVLVFHDVTQKRQAEEALRRSEQNYRALFETMLQGVVYQQADGTIIWMNPAAERILGKTHAEFLGQTSVSVEHDTLREDGTLYPGLEHPSMVALRSGQTVVDVIMQVYNPRQQAYRQIVISAVPLFREGEETPYQVYTVFDDVTERKQAERALSESEERYRKLVETSPAGIYVLQDGKYIYANPVGLAQLGVASIEELSRIPAIEFIAPEYRQAIRERIGRAGEGESNQPLEIEALAVDGSRRTMETRSVPIHLHGRPAVFIQSEDITARKRSEGEVRSSLTQIELQRRLLEQREQERQQIARDLHDGPIQELAGAAYILQPLILDCAEEGTQEQLGAVRAILQEQVSELRSYAQELRPPMLSTFGLAKGIRSHLETFQAKHPALKIDLVIQQEGELLSEHVRVACYRIYQESLVNIVKHSQASQISITLTKTLEELTLEIQDNGVGFAIPQDWLEFARQKHLGLVGIRERAEAIGGTLQIHSTPGAGTRITVNVPLDKAGEDMPARG